MHNIIISKYASPNFMVIYLMIGLVFTVLCTGTEWCRVTTFYPAFSSNCQGQITKMEPMEGPEEEIHLT